MTVDGELLDELWAIAAGQPVVTKFRTAELDVRTSHGAVLVAVDSVGRRHLLVPLATKHTLRQEVDGRAVVLRRRTLEDERTYRSFASLELVEARLTDLFTALCVEIVQAISKTPGRAVAALRKVLDDWRALLSGAREVLPPSALAGLFAELHLLRRMLDRDPGSVAFWTGPTGSAQDFHRGAAALEVKTTASPEGRFVRVHGVDQLDLASSESLTLHWSRLRTDRGTSVPELVDDVLARTDDPVKLRQLLGRVGYVEADREIYVRRRFEVVEQRTYAVGPGFPRIVPATLIGDATLSGIGPVEYTIDLDVAAAEKHRVVADAVDRFIGDA
jgi:Putative  PD-(D/E)XK family member, (DUF4420)